MKLDFAKLLKILSLSTSEFSLLQEDFFKKRKKNNLHFLIFIILSARTKDETTIRACTKLFRRVNSIDDLLELNQKEIQELIYPVGFYKTKSKHLKLLASIVKSKFDSLVPGNMDDLMTLPGVGRKTANLFLNIAFSIPTITVDVHVHRILNRIGYLNAKNPLETEVYLRKNLDKKYWLSISHLLVIYGQNICKPVNPKCEICKIKKYCVYYKKYEKTYTKY